MNSGGSFIFLFSQLTFKTFVKRSSNSLIISIFKVSQVSPSDLQFRQIMFQIWQQNFKDPCKILAKLMFIATEILHLFDLSLTYSFPFEPVFVTPSGLIHAAPVSGQCSWAVFPSVCGVCATHHPLPALPVVTYDCTFAVSCA